MPAPQAAAIKSAITAALPPDDFPQPFQGAFLDFMDKLSSGFAQGWASWQLGITGGKNNVAGLGVGAWAGVGAGGILTEGTPLDFKINVAKRPDQFVIFETELVKQLKNQFNGWATSFIFTAVPYVGATTMIPVPPAPGVFTAVGPPGPLPIGGLGAGVLPSQVKDPVIAALAGHGWDVSNEFFRTGKLLQAVEGAVTQLFGVWILSTMFSGDTVTGPSAPPTGIGVGVSAGTGILA